MIKLKEVHVTTWIGWTVFLDKSYNDDIYVLLYDSFLPLLNQISKIETILHSYYIFY
jgi:hypothetical protein